ncbi:MAG: helix-turn-helix transcriptional regulator [Chitinispirillaceae bacterium]|nr:helix-turn-helix transcriptional regulator [Chitinispirillaceae bacterium]
MQKTNPIRSLKMQLTAAILTIVLLIGVTVFPSLTLKKINTGGRTVTAYDDRTESETPGSSEILSITRDSSMLQFSYILRIGFPYPYAGVTIPFGDSAGNFLDCSSFDFLKFRISSSRHSDCKLYLRVFDRNISRKNEPLSERYLFGEVKLGAIPQEVTVPFRKLSTPDWWFQKNNITRSEAASVDYSQVTALQFESGATATTGVVDTITVSGIYCAKRPNTAELLILASILAAVAVLMLLRLLPPRKKQASIVITYDKKELRNYRDMDAKRIAEYVAEHYSDAALTILTAGKSLGLSQKKIARVMNEEFTMSFKQYLTSIRIHEAKRLLQETDRLVFDIALEVGFNSISHFNRVFKNLTQTSPLEFRGKTVSPDK